MSEFGSYYFYQRQKNVPHVLAMAWASEIRVVPKIFLFYSYWLV